MILLENGSVCLTVFQTVPVPTAVQTLSDDLLKYYQQITRAILGEDLHLMKVSCRRAEHTCS